MCLRTKEGDNQGELTKDFFFYLPCLMLNVNMLGFLISKETEFEGLPDL